MWEPALCGSWLACDANTSVCQANRGEAIAGKPGSHIKPVPTFVFGVSTGSPPNCGKQIWPPLKARHIAAANPCFVTVLTCPHPLWNRLWVTWV
ncbi:hypothetical protein C9382_29905 [Pseudomonas aylmerensis]|uniref:Uncharacterized protein n=1 Tax=Pseudomonas aylmerensis TaxID=1869229 RepID=A0A2T4FJH9_9PSED|nr:hypothetical protein DXV65_02795 [Pseudomonas fluorescens]PTC23582.1 hypothetical protein C9382_29905 [Pseudomonas aylmerensis]